MSLIAEGTTIASLRREIAALLRRAFAADGRDGSPGLDARLLVAHALGRDGSQVAVFDDLPVGADDREVAIGLAERRIAGEPVARIVGRKEFWGLDFELSGETLVPRPDTETLVEAALEAIDRDERRNDGLAILDIGTGSGAILLALLSELPAATGLGTDRAPGAVLTASRNAARLGLAARARFAVADWAAAARGGFNVIVANPPYIESETISGLPAEVARHDPRLGLDGGIDGLDAYRAILADLGRLLSEQGRAFLEVGSGQAGAVLALAGGCGFDAVSRRDLAGVDRVIEIWRR